MTIFEKGRQIYKLPVQKKFYVTVVLESICYLREKPTEKRYNWRDDINLDGYGSLVSGVYHTVSKVKVSDSSLFFTPYSSACGKGSFGLTLPGNFFSTLRSYCPQISVVLLSYNNRSTLIRLDGRIFCGRYHSNSDKKNYEIQSY